jgi:hypothetical protein
MKALLRILKNQRGCFGGGPAPKPPAPIPQEEQIDATVKANRSEEERRRRVAAYGSSQTSILAGNQTLAPANVGKTMLG